jgi:hypothetical protein
MVFLRLQCGKLVRDERGLVDCVCKLQDIVCNVSHEKCEETNSNTEIAGMKFIASLESMNNVEVVRFIVTQHTSHVHKLGCMHARGLLSHLDCILCVRNSRVCKMMMFILFFLCCVDSSHLLMSVRGTKIQRNITNLTNVKTWNLPSL